MVQPSGFLSTPSARRATYFYSTSTRNVKFLSTPSARRATQLLRSQTARTRYFYPRPPRGGRPSRRLTRIGAKIFLSTPSARRATPISSGYWRPPLQISIHALREEGDTGCSMCTTIPCHFYPRPPRGGRPATSMTCSWFMLFLSTPSARRATF